MFKRLMAQRFVQVSIAFLLAAYMGLVRRTTRWQFEGLENSKPLQQGGKGFIVCVWHSRFLMANAGWTKMPQKPHFLISKSRDGDLVAAIGKAFGINVIRGSRRTRFKDKDKRGAGALREMIDVIKNGDCVIMTPDGPRGPRMHMGEGAIRLARLSGAPIIGYALSTSNNITFKTWDRFMFPLPFGRGKIIYTGTVSVGIDADDAAIELARQKMQSLLNQASQSCDKQMGTEIILPYNTQDPEKDT